MCINEIIFLIWFYCFVVCGFFFAFILTLPAGRCFIFVSLLLQCVVQLLLSAAFRKFKRKEREEGVASPLRFLRHCSPPAAGREALAPRSLLCFSFSLCNKGSCTLERLCQLEVPNLEFFSSAISFNVSLYSNLLVLCCREKKSS
jgi:hypothetical protein